MLIYSVVFLLRVSDAVHETPAGRILWDGLMRMMIKMASIVVHQGDIFIKSEDKHSV